MNRTLVILVLLVLDTSFLSAQQVEKDLRPQNDREDYLNRLNSDNITKLDLIQALEAAGIGIHKFSIGTFYKKYHLRIIIDEYKDGKIIKNHLSIKDNNEYYYFKDGNTEPSIDYIDQIKLFSKIEDSVLNLQIDTYKGSLTKKIKYYKTEEEQFYRLRTYSETLWKLNRKVPLLVFASSWKDKKGDFQRFCAAIDLSHDEKQTLELLTSSPHYFVVSYEITEYSLPSK